MTDDTMMRAALDYAALGWPVFPTRHNKAPHTPNGHLDATTDPDKIETWWKRWPGANIGFSPGNVDLLVLDYDPGSSIEAAEKAIGDLPETGLIASTPRGGEHHYYALLEDDEPVASRVHPFTEHVDTRSFGGYVLLPPSSTKDGDYEWAKKKKPAQRSQALLDACAKATEKDPDRDEWHIEPDLPDNVELATKWLRGEVPVGNSHCAYAVQGSGGDNITYATAAMMKSCGISEGTALELMWEHWNDQCQPPWEYDALAGKIANGYAYNTSPPGNVTPAYHVARVAGLFEPAKVETMGGGHQWSKGRFRLVDGPGLAAITPPEWLLPDTIPEDSYVLLSGKTESYKTFLALDAALTLATGGGALVAGEWDGFWGSPRRAGPVLFAAGEGRANLRKRAEAWMQYHHGHQNVPQEFALIDPVPHIFEGEEGMAAFFELARKRHENYALVVIDTVARAMSGTNENAQENATAFTRMVDDIRRELGASVLALHHTGHGDQDRARGSSAFLGDPDTLFMAHRAEKGLTRVSMTKQKDADTWEEPRWARLEAVNLGDGRDSLVATVGKPSKKAQDTEARATFAVLDHFLLDFLQKNPSKEFSMSELARLLPYHLMTDGEGDEVELGMGERNIRNNDAPVSLQKLRAPNSGALTQSMYDPRKDKWRYSPVAASSFSSTD